MTKYQILFFLISGCLLLTACQNQNANSNAVAAVKQNVKPIADAEIAVIEMEDGYGTIKIEFYSNIAPNHVARFKELAKEGVYNRTAFHRIDPQLGIIQGGDPNSKDDDPANDGQGNSTKPNLAAEFSDVPYDTGILGAARGQTENSANSQFFLMTKRQPAFDNRYTVYGKVIEGQEVVNKLSIAPTSSGTRPLGAQVIKSVTITAK